MDHRRSVASGFIKNGYQKQKVIKFSDVFHSTYYYKPKTTNPQSKPGKPIPGYSINDDGTIIPDIFIVNLLKSYRDKIVFSNAGGYKTLSKYLKKDYGIRVNKKKVYRLCKENNLLLPKKKKQKKFKKICNNHTITKPNQLWQFDIKYGYILGIEKPFFLLAFVDVFTKIVVSHHIGLSCKAIDLKLTLQLALDKLTPAEKETLTIRSDNGSQMSSNEFKRFVEANTITHEFTPVQCPNKNAFVESFFSIFEIEFLQVRYLKDFRDAYEQTNEWINWYNNSRLHGSLNYLSPYEFKNNFYTNSSEFIQISA